MAGSIYQLRAAMKTAAAVTAGGFTMSASRIVLGYKPMTADNTFFQTILTDGPWLQIRPGQKQEHMTLGTSRISTYSVMSDLWIGLDRESADAFTNIETLLEAIDAAWVGYPTTWAAPEIYTGRNPALVYYELESEVMAGC